MKLIDKDALVAEIDRQKIGYNTDGKHSIEYDTTRKILDLIDTIEVKEVDNVWHDASEKPERDDLLIETNDGRIIHRQSINNYGMVKRWAYCKDILNLSNVERTGKDWKEEPVSGDLGEYINELSKQFPEVSFAKLSRIAVRVAKWQKEQMMKDATEAIVKVDAGGYPYIPQIELYDYDKDVSLAKEGGKYKVILIKEE